MAYPAHALDRRGRGRDALRAEDERLAAFDGPEDGGQVAARPVQVRLDDLQRDPCGDGISPSSTTRVRVRCATGSGTTAAERSACVYGCFGAAKSSSVPALSTICPMYITATRSQRY